MAITILKQNPNKKALALSLGVHVLEELSSFSAKATDRMSTFSPLTRELMANIPGFTEVYINRGTAADTLTIAKTSEWTQAEADAAIARVQAYIISGKRVVAEAQLIRSGSEEKTFIPKTPSERIIDTICRDVINVAMGIDGGSCQIKNVIENPNNTVDLHITLSGSCTTCPKGKITTLLHAKKLIVAAFADAQQQKETGGKKFGTLTVLPRARGDQAYTI